MTHSSTQLNHVPLEQLKDIISDIFYRILITWHHSKFFATGERIKLLVSKVCYLTKNSFKRYISL